MSFMLETETNTLSKYFRYLILAQISLTGEITKVKEGGKQQHIFINDIKNFKILSSSIRTYLQDIAHWKQIAWLVGKAMLRINKPGKAGLRAAQGTYLGFRAGKPLKLQTANKNTAGMQGSHISSTGFISVLFKLQLTNLRIPSQFLLTHN